MVPIGLGLWAGETASMARLGVGAVTVLTLTLLMLFAPPALRLWGPLLAMGSGYGVAALTGELHFAHSAQAAWFGLPPLSAWPGLELDIRAAHLPLGGLGASGFGRYRGRAGFETFSHLRSVMRRGWSFDPGLVFPPYRVSLERLRALLRWTG
jgi:hypothetical protein